MAERQADAPAALGRILGLLRPLVRVHAVHPARVGREAHDEERVVRERDALRRAPRRTAVAVAAAAAFFVRSVMVRRAPSERFTMRELRTTSTVLSECSEM